MPFPQFRINAGSSAADIRFGPLGYASEALQSYAVFSRLRGAGAIPAGVRFQVSLPTPLAVVFAFMLRVEPEVRPVWPAYERAMLAEIDAIAAAIPHDELAFQWDIAAEFTTILEKAE